ncbi:MAG: family 20 glycosylhydrolase [Gemmatimonadetes bacterium]|nr:family 20 glycosylhydrolase [Gemmatimonadota bacterium]
MLHGSTRPVVRPTTVALLLLATAACAGTPRPPARPAPQPAVARIATLIPAPVRGEAIAADSFIVTDSTPLVITADAPEGADQVARSLAALLAPPQVVRRISRLPAGANVPAGALVVRGVRGGAQGGAQGAVSGEGYVLRADRAGVSLEAASAAGLFNAVQTLRQLLPVNVEHRGAVKRILVVPGVEVHDQPRYAWRGAMLDVARHFLPIDGVKRYLDAMALYKLNVLHLHLSDDQGWRLEISAWPALTRVGGSTQVGGGGGGYYTQAQYADLVAYAAERFITIVPEFDMPGHTNAALASIPELNCNDTAPPLYTGTKVGFSALCASREAVYRFIDDVVREVSAITPGPYFHLGGDEVEKLTHDEYLRFVERVEGIVRAHGKRAMGWGEIAAAKLDASTIVHHWRPARTRASDSSHVHAARGGQVVLSPAHRTYFDMKYDSSNVLGYTWAAVIPLRAAYDWNPETLLAGVSGRAILGVEGPLWSETIERPSEFEWLGFPRLVALAEVGWTPQEGRAWESFRVRLAAHGRRLSAVGVNFHRTPEVDWRN